MLKGRTVSHSVSISARTDFFIIDSNEDNIIQWLFWESDTWIAGYFCGTFQQLSLQIKMAEKTGSTIQRTVYLTCWMMSSWLS